MTRHPGKRDPRGVTEYGKNPRKERAGEGDSSNSVHEVGLSPEPVSKPRIHRTDPKKITKASRSELPYKPLPKFKTNSQEAHAPG